MSYAGTSPAIVSSGYACCRAYATVHYCKWFSLPASKAYRRIRKSILVRAREHDLFDVVSHAGDTVISLPREQYCLPVLGPFHFGPLAQILAHFLYQVRP